MPEICMHSFLCIFSHCALPGAKRASDVTCNQPNEVAAQQGISLPTPGKHRGLSRAALPMYSLPLLPEAAASSAEHPASLPAWRQAHYNHYHQTTMHEGWHMHIGMQVLPVMGARLVPWCAGMAASLPDQEQQAWS